MELTEKQPAEAGQVPAVQPAKKPVKPKKKRKWVKVLVILAILAALIFLFIIRPILSATQSLTNALYTPTTVSRQDITVSVSGSATIQANDSYQVTTLLRGEILEAPFEEGDMVQAGDVLYVLDSSDVETSVRQAQLAVDQARLNYEDMLKNQDDLTVTANGSGVVQKLYVKAGDSVTAGAAIADIVDRDVVTLEVPFHSQLAQSMWVGQQASVTVDGTVEALNGTVTEISGADQVTAGGALVRTVSIEVRNPGAITNTSTGTASVDGQACAASGPFSYRTEKTVTAKASGDIESLAVSEGTRVSDGQALCVIGGSSTESQIEAARLSLENAELSLQSAQDKLEDYTITAPISGEVVEKNFKVGDNLDSTNSEALAVIFDMSSLSLELDVDEVYIGQIEVGQTVEITANALEGQTFTGTVTKVNINGKTTNGITSYPVTITVEDGGDLWPGMNVNAEILVEHAENVLAVPVEAVSRGNVVLVPGEGAIGSDGSVDPGKLTEVPVTLGRNDAHYVEILSGLEEGDTIIIEQSFSSLMDQMMGTSNVVAVG